MTTQREQQLTASFRRLFKAREVLTAIAGIFSTAWCGAGLMFLVLGEGSFGAWLVTLLSVDVPDFVAYLIVNRRLCAVMRELIMSGVMPDDYDD